MKILALGNSFSEDATAYLEHLAPALYVRNLHIPGCSLETHAEHLAAGDSAYVLQEHGHAIRPEHVAANEILSGTPWDVVTVQQASHFSGLAETYEPYLTEVLAAVRALCPGARIVLHETWAYATDSTHPQFSHYHKNQTEMAHGLEIIPSGRFIAYLRAHGPSLGDEYTRDGFHMHIPYGRYAVALVWAHFFGAEVSDFVPEGADSETLRAIRELYDRFASTGFGISDGAEP